MKPIKLTMEGFGPFGNKEEIDFTQLEDNTLFLITGATGSGKTTIFDAISYALYGEASGENRKAKDFISHFSDLDTLTQVELIFELKGKKYKIRRIPEQDRYKKVGEGVTTQASSAELEVLDTNLNFSGVKDVDEKVKDIIGLDSNQFTQIMMIPQGEFRKMLLAESKEREKILQKLFDTTLYSTIQSRFSEIEKEMKNEILNGEILLEQAIHRIDYKDNEEMKEMLGSQYLNYTGIFNLSEVLIKKDKKNIKELNKKYNSLKKEIDNKNKKLSIGKNINEKINQKYNIQEELKKEKEKEENINLLETRIKKGKKYLNIKPYEDSYFEKEKDIENLKEDIKETKIQKENIKENYNSLKTEKEIVDSKEYSQEIEKLKEDIKENKKLIPKIQEKKQLTNEKGELEKKYKGLGITLETLKINLEKNKKDRDKIDRDLDTLLNLKEDFNKLENKLLELNKDFQYNNKILKEKEVLEKNENKLKEIIKAKKNLEYNISKKEMEYNKLKENYFSNLGAILAKELVEGSPCPVCGSTHHVKKAEFGNEDISKEILEKNEEEKENLQNKLKKIEKEYISFIEKNKSSQKNIEEYKENLINSDKNKDVILNEIKKLEKKKVEIEEKINKVEKEKTEKEKLKKEIETNEEKIDIKTLELQNINKTLTIVKTKIEEIKKSLEKDLKIEEITNLISRLEKNLEEKENKKDKIIKKFDIINERRIKVETKLQEFNKSLIKEEVSLKTKEKTFLEKMVEEGFSDKNSYSEACLSKEELNKIEKEVKAYREHKNFLVKQLEKLNEETKDKKLMDIKKLETEINSLEKTRETNHEIITNLNTKIKNSINLLSEVKKNHKIIEDKKEKHSIYNFLSELINGKGKNGLDKLSLERFVQIEFFEDIIIAANQRLTKMTEERYYMERAKEYSRARQIGLDLNVHDNYTGKSRSVKTLSGGESFKASLALALGLSDVVQSYSGGVQLDTIFIDEGFGSLDPESLESSINCLVDIQQKGRLVGIISHVEELKERIETRLEVTATNRGSNTDFVIK